MPSETRKITHTVSLLPTRQCGSRPSGVGMPLSHRHSAEIASPREVGVAHIAVCGRCASPSELESGQKPRWWAPWGSNPQPAEQRTNELSAVLTCVDTPQG